jgi:hypothetical protein
MFWVPFYISVGYLDIFYGGNVLLGPLLIFKSSYCLFSHCRYIYIHTYIYIYIYIHIYIYIMLAIRPFSDAWFASIFFSSLHFHSVDWFFCCVEVFSLLQPCLSIFVFIFCTFGVIPKRSLPRSMPKRFFSCFLLEIYFMYFLKYLLYIASNIVEVFFFFCKYMITFEYEMLWIR